MNDKQICVTVGTGTAVHRAFLWGDTWSANYQLFKIEKLIVHRAFLWGGAGGVGSAQIRLGISPLRHVAGPATCRRCLAMAAKAKAKTAEGGA